MGTAFWYKLAMTGILLIVSFGSFWQMLGLKKIRPVNILFGIELPAVRLDSEEAGAVTEQYKRESAILLGAMIIVCIIFWFAPISSEHVLLVFIVIAIAICFSMYIPFFIANRRLRTVKKAKRWYAVSEQEDSDKYWPGGVIYYNKHDPATRVISRLNMKKTFNLGSRRGRSFAIVLVVFALVVVWYAFRYIGYEDNLVPALVFHSDGVIEVDSTYGQEFLVSDIVEVSLVDTIPVTMRIIGTSTGKIRRGTFEVTGCPKSTLYIFNDITPYIKIKLMDKYIFFNCPTPEATTGVYEQLQSAVSKREAA